MALKETVKKLTSALEAVAKDLVKAEKGNSAAAQRVRTGTIKLEKIAKTYRKESVKAKKSGTKKKTAPKRKAPAKKKAAPKKTAAAKKRAPAKKKAAPKRKAPKRKPAAKKRKK